MSAEQMPVDRAEWERAIADFTSACERSGLKPATVSLRIRTLRAFAEGLSTGPWDVTKADYVARLAEVPVSPSRTAVRAFYRWAARTRRVAADPTLEPSRLPEPLPAPATWESSITLFEAAQLANGLSPATVDLRARLVRLFARETGCTPWHLTWEEYRSRLDGLPVNDTTRRTYRTAVRAFYRWALATQRVTEDPTDEPSRRAQISRATPAWEAEILPFQRYLRGLGHPETTIRLMSSDVRRIARELAALDPFDVSTDDLLEVLASKRTWQSETRRHHVNALRSFYRWAKVAGRTKKNPAKRIPTVRRQTKIVDPATEQSLAEALAKAGSRERLAIRLAAELGLRRTEVTLVHSRDLSGEDGDWWLVVHGKGAKDRRIPITDELAHALRARENGWAFPGHDHGHLSAQQLGDRISDLLPPGVTMHKLRHRFATRAYNVDHDVFTLQQLLGHASPATTQRYVRVTGDQQRRLVEAVRKPALAVARGERAVPA